VMALPLAAQAQPVTGFYIGAGAGVNIMQDEPVSSANSQSFNNVNVQTDVGAAGVLSAGWGWGNGLRTEFEAQYRYNSLKSLSGPNGNSGTCVSNGRCSGSEQKFGPMPTVLYDFTTVSPMFIPYIGAGIGYQLVDEKLSVGNSSGSKTEGAFAYQAILGAAFPIASVPGLAVTAEYRFMGVGDRTYNF